MLATGGAPAGAQVHVRPGLIPEFPFRRRIVKHRSGFSNPICRSGLTGVFLLAGTLAAWTQQAGSPPQSASLDPATAAAVQDLRQEVRELRTLVGEMRVEAADSRAESADLRRELQALRSQLAASGGPGPRVGSDAASAGAAPSPTNGETQPAQMEDRVSNLEESSQLLGAKVNEQYQTKVESASKYRLRLSGIVLLNVFSNHGSADNLDFPSYAMVPNPYFSNASLGASLRQSEIGLEVFGPRLAGARTSGTVQADFAGGFPSISNGVTSGLFRLRIASMRLDWKHTSVVGGQDDLFLSPNAPTSFASLAVPAFSYAGNLWGWIPQVRVEHRFELSENSSVLVVGGLLDNLSGEPPYNSYGRIPGGGERSGQPGYGGRVAWSGRILGQAMTFGGAGYYGRQQWGFQRYVNGWAGMVDWDIPLTQSAAITGEFYRGSAIGGLGGGIGRSVLFSGNPLDPATLVRSLNTIGGWSQLKIKATPKLEFNGGFGLDNPFAMDIRAFSASQSYLDPSLSRNLASLVNFVYRPRSNLLFSSEYRRLFTSRMAEESYPAAQVNLVMGVLF